MRNADSPFVWSVRIAIDPLWIADGFVLNADMLRDALITRCLPGAKDSEVKVTIEDAPSEKAIRKAQGRSPSLKRSERFARTSTTSPKVRSASR